MPGKIPEKWRTIWHFSHPLSPLCRPLLSRWARASAFGALSICWRATARTTPAQMLMYGKEASNRKQEIDRQHHTIPNQRNQRPKDKHRGNVYNLLFRHGKVRSQNMEKLKCSFPTFCKQTFPQLHKTASYAHSHSAYVGEILRITYNMYNLNFFRYTIDIRYTVWYDI